MDTILLKVQLLALQSTEEGNSDTPSLPGGNEAFFHPIWQLLHLWHKIKRTGSEKSAVREIYW